MQQQEPKNESSGTLRLVYWESVMALRSRGVQISLLIFSLLLIVALLLGVVHTQKRQSDSRLAQQENSMIKEIFQNALQGTLEPPREDDPKTTRESRITRQLRMSASSPYLASHSTNLWDVSLIPSPLSSLSVGASRAWPDQYRIHGISLAQTVQRSERVRPFASVYGPFDVAFVVLAIAPLIIIGLTFDVSSRDRESAMQNLIVAQTQSLGKLIAIRCLVRAALVIGLIVCLVNGTLWFVFGSQFDSNVVSNLVIWNVTSGLYLLIWASLSLFVNSLSKTSSSNGATLLILWLLLVLLVPNLVSAGVQQAVPVRPASELADIEQAAFDQATENVAQLVEQFQSEHPDVEIRLDDEQQMTLVRYLLAHDSAGKQAAANVFGHYAGQSRRAMYLDYCGLISPAISLQNQSNQCSGNRESTLIAFSAHAADIQAQVVGAFLLPSITNQPCTVETLEGLPDLQESLLPKTPSWQSASFAMVSLLVWLVVLMALGIRRFRVKNFSSNKKKRLPETGGVERA